MVRLSPLVLLTLTTGCLFSPTPDGVDPLSSEQICERYLDCVTAVDPGVVAAMIAAYGAESPCWATAADSARCETACREGLLDYFSIDPAEPSCSISGVIPFVTDEPFAWAGQVSRTRECLSSETLTEQAQAAATTTPLSGSEFTLEFEGHPVDCAMQDQWAFTCEGHWTEAGGPQIEWTDGRVADGMPTMSLRLSLRESDTCNVTYDGVLTRQ